MSYAHYFNKKYDQVGCIFQGPYGSRLIETDSDLINTSKYIHNNPAEFTDPLSYEWSSIQSYIHGYPDVADPAYILKILNGAPYTLS